MEYTLKELLTIFGLREWRAQETQLGFGLKPMSSAGGVAVLQSSVLGSGFSVLMTCKGR